MTDQELNEAVARKFGWKKHNKTCEQLTPGASIFTGGDHWYQKGYMCRETMTDYCHSIKAAWEIPGLESVVKITDGRWHARFGDGSKLNTYYEIGIYEREEPQWNMPEAIADTAPRAICEAFLKLNEQK